MAMTIRCALLKRALTLFRRDYLEHPTTIGSRLLIAACALQAACDDQLGALDEPDLGTVESRSTGTVVSTNDEYPLYDASGTEVVVSNDNNLAGFAYTAGATLYSLFR